MRKIHGSRSMFLSIDSRVVWRRQEHCKVMDSEFCLMCLFIMFDVYIYIYIYIWYLVGLKQVEDPQKAL